MQSLSIRTLISLTIAFLSGGLAGPVFGQTGPAGVGNAGGAGEQPQNVLWLRGEDFSGSTWTDRSGNGTDATVSAGAPSPVNDAIDGNDVVRFDGDDELDFSSASSPTLVTELPSGDNTLIVVSKREDNATAADQFLFRAPTGDNNRVLAYRLNVQRNTNKTLASVNGRNFNNDGTSTSDLTPTTYNILHTAFSGTADSMDVGVNGTVKRTATGATNKTPSSALLGRNLSGDVAEVIAFDSALNTAQFRIVLNYLSARYGIDVQNEDFDYAPFGTDVAGIGRDQTDLAGPIDGGSHTQAQSGLLQFGVSSFANDDQFVLFGHDGASRSGSGQSVNRNGATETMTRTWRVDLTGTQIDRSLDVTLNRDSLQTYFPLSGSYNDYAVYVDTDGDFSNGATFYDLSSSGTTTISVDDGAYVTVARVERTLSFGTDAKSDFEPASDADPNLVPSLNASLNFPNSEAMTVDVRAVSSATESPGATAGGTDFTTCCATATSKTLAKDQTSYNLNAIGTPLFEIEGDAMSEPTEYADVELQNLTSNPDPVAPGDNPDLVFGIVDEDASTTASFNGSDRSASEETPGSFTVRVDLSTAETVDLDYELGGSATLNSDYERRDGVNSTTGTLSFSNESQESFTLDLLDDNDFEGSETIDVTLTGSSSSDVTLVEDGGGLPTVTLTITENESQPSVSFTSDSFTGATEGTNEGLTLTLSKSSAQDTEIDFSATGISAESSDYAVVSDNPITIPAGVTEKDLVLSLEDDEIVEANEVVEVRLTGATNASIADPDTAETVILDDDAIGARGPGGVGDAEAIPLWLRADKGTPSSGSVSTWEDQSGNDNDATSPAGQEPTITSSVSTLNNQPAVTFDSGNSEYFDSVPNLTDIPKKDNTIFIVWDRQGTGTQGLLEVAKKITGGGKLPQARSMYYDGSNVISANDETETSGNGSSTPALLSSHYDESGGLLDIAANRDTLGTASGVSAASGFYGVIGARLYDNDNDNKSADDTPQDFFDGHMAEVVVYDQALNESERIIVANALAAKYDLTLTQEDYYVGDSAANGDYDAEVGGIGSEGSLPREGHLDAAAGDVQLFTNSFKVGEYVFIGDKIRVDTLNRVSTVNTPSGITARSKYAKFLDTKGQPTFDVEFDLREMGLLGAADNPINYRFLYEENGTWKIPTPSEGVSVVDEGGEVRISGIELPKDFAGKVTLGTTNHALSPIDTRFVTLRGSSGNEAAAGSNGDDAGYFTLGLPVKNGTAGTIISAKTGDPLFTPDTLALPGLGDPYNLVYTWDYDRQKFVGVTDSSTALPNGRGFWLWAKDNANLPLDPELTFGIPDRVDVPRGDVSISVPHDDSLFVFAANPYLSPYDMGTFTDLAANGFQATIAAWNSNNAGTYGSYTVKTQFTSGDVMARYQGFYLKRDTSISGATSFTFDDAGRVTDDSRPLVGGRKSASSMSSSPSSPTNRYRRLDLVLQVRNEQGEKIGQDLAANLFFHERADTTWDPYDTVKYEPLSSEYATLALVGTGPDGTRTVKSQESRTLTPDQSFTVDLQLDVKDVDGTFAIAPRRIEYIPDDWTITLIDTKTGDEVPLTDSTTYRFDVSFEKRAVASSSPPGESGRPPGPKRMRKAQTEPRFQIHVSPERSAEGALPVELSDVNAAVDDRDVILTWETHSETGNVGFEVERKTAEYETVGFVEGAGTTDRPQEYRYRVPSLSYGTHTFRLRQIDNDGQATVLDTVRAAVRLRRGHDVGKPHPNPFRSETKLNVTVRRSQSVRVTLYDVLGRRLKVLHRKRIPAQETHTVSLPDERLASGTYFLRVKGDSFTEVRRVVHIN